MQRQQMGAMALIALSVPLGACNSFLGINFARHARPAAPVVAEAPGGSLVPGAGPATEIGRRQLAEGQTGLAIESFQKALANAEPAAPAVNGLGVAFARLGRFELALHYFQQAMAADPANKHYEENIARLMRSPTFAMRHDGDLAAAALKPEEPVGEARSARASNETPVPGKLQRVSRGEVRIATVAPRAAPLRGTAAQLDQRFRPLVRVTFAEPLAARSKPTAAHAARTQVDKGFRPLVRVAFPVQYGARAPSDVQGRSSQPNSTPEAVGKTDARR